jgi:hypothetical protein
MLHKVRDEKLLVMPVHRIGNLSELARIAFDIEEKSFR